MSFLKPRLGDSDFPRIFLDQRPDTSEPESIGPLLAPSPNSSAVTDRRADLVCLSDIEAHPVDWLWQNRLASGTVAMISGVPGSGKTWAALAIAAGLSRVRVPLTAEYSIEVAAERDGVCITALRRAKFDLGVLSTKESVSGSWFWELP